MCLTHDGNTQQSKLFYSSCNANDQNQYFIFKRQEDSSIISGKFHSLSDDNYCIEMHNTFQTQVFLHTNCRDTWEIMDNSVLRNIGDNECIGTSPKDITTVAAVDCTSEDVDALSLFDPNLHSFWDDFIFVHKTNYTTDPEESVEASFFYNGANEASWIAIYPASEDPSSLPSPATMWQRSCESVGSVCPSIAKSGIAVFNSKSKTTMKSKEDGKNFSFNWPLDTGEWRIHVINDQEPPYKAVLSSDVFFINIKIAEEGRKKDKSYY
jgi:hypothetical protein